jgi:hypothetical protein
MEENQNTKKKLNKKLLIPMFALLLIGTVFAVGYVVNNFVVKSDVYEPFTVQWAVIGDADNWDGVTGCDVYTGAWANVPTDGLDVDMVGLYAGEGRAVCFKITNLAQADIDYTISNSILDVDGDWSNYDKCLSAFGVHTLSGVATQLTDTKTGVGVVVVDSAEPVNDCRLKIEVSRG